MGFRNKLSCLSAEDTALVSRQPVVCIRLKVTDNFLFHSDVYPVTSFAHFVAAVNELSIVNLFVLRGDRNRGGDRRRRRVAGARRQAGCAPCARAARVAAAETQQRCVRWVRAAGSSAPL